MANGPGFVPEMTSSREPDIEVKIVLVGDPHVGKTSLLRRECRFTVVSVSPHSNSDGQTPVMFI